MLVILDMDMQDASEVEPHLPQSKLRGLRPHLDQLLSRGSER